MGLRFRKSINIGPLRINLSKSGVGFSLGVKGFRVGRSAKGKTTATVSLPGTGLSYVQDLSPEKLKEAAGDVAEFVDDIKDKFDGDDDKEAEKEAEKKESTKKSSSSKKSTSTKKSAGK